MEKPDASTLAQAIDESLREVLGKYDVGTVVTKWALCLQVHGGTEEASGTWILSPIGQDIQDDVGLFYFALIDTKTRIHLNILAESEEE